MDGLGERWIKGKLIFLTPSSQPSPAGEGA